MMESVKKSARPRAAGQKPFTKSAVFHAVYGLLGFLVAHGAVMGNLAPFGSYWHRARIFGARAP